MEEVFQRRSQTKQQTDGSEVGNRIPFPTSPSPEPHSLNSLLSPTTFSSRRRILSPPAADDNPLLHRASISPSPFISIELAGSMGTEDVNEDPGSWYSKLVDNQWVAPPISSSLPPGRYKHAAAVVGEKLYVLGGSRNGRHISDIQVLDLTDFTWSSLRSSIEQKKVELENGSMQEVFPAISGHDVIVWGKKLFVLGGQQKKNAEHVMVRFIDLETMQCVILETTGKLPVAREGQSFSLVGSKLIMFGGEDAKRKLLNDIHILDLETMSWTEVETTQPPPSPRYDHTATVHAERYLLIFGGCSHSACFNDVHVLDLQTLEWSQPENRGDLATPRAGHSGAVISDEWFLVGGGDNKTGNLETIVLDLTKLVCSVVTKVNERHPLASEGISLCAALIGGVKYLVAYGGYNGKYNNEVFIMKPKLKEPAPRKLLLSPAAAAAAVSVSAAYLLGPGGKTSVPKAEYPSGDSEIKHPHQESSVNTSRAGEEKRLLELSLAEVREENSKLRGKLLDVKNTQSELAKELLSVQTQLAEERSRCFKLEAQIVELRNLLRSLPAIEADVLSLRGKISAIEQTPTTEKHASRGIFGWIGGGDS